jgi:hypothetical protein
MPGVNGLGCSVNFAVFVFIACVLLRYPKPVTMDFKDETSNQPGGGAIRAGGVRSIRPLPRLAGQLDRSGPAFQGWVGGTRRFFL